MSLSRDRLKKLEDIETDVVKVIESASKSLLELSKQQPEEEFVIARTTEFLKGLEGVERQLNEQISYLSQVSTNQQHEGSVYSEEKRFHLVCENTDSVLQRLKNIEKRVTTSKKE